jgi:PAS domain S-box-containing protein
MSVRDQPGAISEAELQRLWELSFRRTTRGISIIDPETLRLRAVNPAFARMHGGSPEDFAGLSLASVLSPASAGRIEEVADLIALAGFAAFEAEHVRRDGSVFPTATEVISTAAGGGEAVFYLAWITDLSERREEANRRRAAERQFEMAFARAAAGMALVGIDGRWLRANRSFCELVDLEPEALYAMTAADLTHPDDLDATLEADARLLAGEVDGYELEKRYLRRGGEPVWVRIAVGLLRGEDGEPLHYVVTTSDISLHKMMEEDLARTVSGAQVDRELMCAIGPERTIVRLDGRWREVLGWAPEELQGRAVGELIHPDDRNGALRALAALGGEGAEWQSFRCRVKARSGNWIWLDWSAVAPGDPEEALCTVREVGDRLAVERVLDLRAEMIANMAEGACLVATGNQRIVFANPGLEGMLGYGAGELVGRRAREVMWPDDLTAAEIAQREAAAAELAATRTCTYEGRRTRRDGRDIWCRTTTTTFEHPRYGPVWVAVMHDVTEERRAREAAAELEQAKSEFLGSVSHELRTPLTSILGYAALLREDTAGIDGAAEHIEVIERNAGRQLRLVEDLLSIARIEAGEFTVKRLPLDLAEVVRHGVGAMRPAAEEAGLRLEMDCESPLKVLGDADRLDQVVANLLSNAIKFTPAGGRVEVALRGEGREARLTVTDSGPGFESLERERLFERLFRGDDVKRLQVEGAGLGLAIARSIVEAHGGRIEADAEPGGGATFAVTLPIEPTR